MKCILDLDEDELNLYLQSIQQPPFRAMQIWHGLYHSYFDNWDQFSNLPLLLRRQLASEFSILPIQEIKEVHTQNRSTKKVLFQLSSGNSIESVLMNSLKRTSICISSQSGCSMGCKFCATGKLGFKQNLSAGEILAQVLFFARELQKTQKKITNIVMMGMGEPFLNYEQVKKAICIINSPRGLNVGARRITVSTIGIPEGIIQFAHDFSQVNLAVSLHAATNEKRDQLVPINRKFPIEAVLKAVEQYILITNRRVTFEYVMIKGLNDSPEGANQLGVLLGGILCHVNLIPLNPCNHFAYQPSSQQSIKTFQGILEEYHVPTTIRASKGTTIQAGCGQLGGTLS